MSEWVIAAIAVIVIGTVAATAIVLILGNWNNQNQSPTGRAGNWHIDLWNIRYGTKVSLRFASSIVVGRYDLYQANWSVPVDHTISREHVLIYEQDGILWMWNMSAVNPAMINGHRLNAPIQLHPGNRLELGRSVFLITEVQYS